mmetsp:Transcript_8104/g.12016  ORF Transcript_8104/g.12016 Transcript_8104/m.12016 type:complete len:356 (-) Transcript_8104:772-1839(-)
MAFVGWESSFLALRGVRDLRSSKSVRPSRGRISGMQKARMSFSMLAGIPVDSAIAVTTIASIGQLMVAILIGVLSSKRGILTKDNVKVMSTINYNILLPCLSLSSVIRAFQTDVIVGLGILPIVAGLQILVGLTLGFLFSKVLKIESEADKRIMIVSSAYINGGTIALFLSSTLFGTNLVKSAEFVAAVSLYLIGWSVLFWTIGYSILTNWTPSEVEGETKSTISVRETMANVSWRRVISPPIIGTGQQVPTAVRSIIAGKGCGPWKTRPRNNLSAFTFLLTVPFPTHFTLPPCSDHAWRGDWLNETASANVSHSEDAPEHRLPGSKWVGRCLCALRSFNSRRQFDESASQQWTS